MARAETKGSFNRSYFDGRPRLEEIREFYEAIAQDQSVEIHCRGEGEIYAEPVLFRRALINLITNALRFTPEGGRITVSFDRRDGESEVSSPIRGAGFRRNMSRTFSTAFSGATRRVTLQGTGLGLAIVKSIMHVHEGDVSVQSELNKGTVVTLTFPDAKTTEPSPDKRIRHRRPRVSAA